MNKQTFTILGSEWIFTPANVVQSHFKGILTNGNNDTIEIYVTAFFVKTSPGSSHIAFTKDILDIIADLQCA